jgi:DNA-directed RNA polymerase subunit RPC12/RpoP
VHGGIDTTNHVERLWHFIKYTLFNGKVNRSLTVLLVTLVGRPQTALEQQQEDAQVTLDSIMQRKQNESESPRFSRRLASHVRNAASRAAKIAATAQAITWSGGLDFRVRSDAQDADADNADDAADGGSPDRFACHVTHFIHSLSHAFLVYLSSLALVPLVSYDVNLAADFCTCIGNASGARCKHILACRIVLARDEPELFASVADCGADASDVRLQIAMPSSVPLALPPAASPPLADVAAALQASLASISILQLSPDQQRHLSVFLANTTRQLESIVNPPPRPPSIFLSRSLKQQQRSVTRNHKRPKHSRFGDVSSTAESGSGAGDDNSQASSSSSSSTSASSSSSSSSSSAVPAPASTFHGKRKRGSAGDADHAGMSSSSNNSVPTRRSGAGIRSEKCHKRIELPQIIRVECPHCRVSQPVGKPGRSTQEIDFECRECSSQVLVRRVDKMWEVQQVQLTGEPASDMSSKAESKSESSDSDLDEEMTDAFAAVSAGPAAAASAAEFPVAARRGQRERKPSARVLDMFD